MKNNKKNLLEEGSRHSIILKTIVKTYLETGEPVGSRTISKQEGFDLSPATIRNVMSDLVEEGYIIQPHTSAGRIPSDKGYRYYVDQIIKDKEIEIEKLKGEMFSRVDKLENMMTGLVRAIATNTQYAALVSAPSTLEYKIKYVQISQLEIGKLLIVVVCEGNIFKTTTLELGDEINIIPTPEELLKVSLLISKELDSKTISNLNKETLEELASAMPKSKKLIGMILAKIIEVLTAESNDSNILTSGANNLFKYPEITSGENADSLLKTFETKNELVSIINNSKNDKNEIKVYIGKETGVGSMEDCSVITANCNFGNGLVGTIGVIGPKRMNYEKVIGTIKSLMIQAEKELE